MNALDFLNTKEETPQGKSSAMNFLADVKKTPLTISPEVAGYLTAESPDTPEKEPNTRPAWVSAADFLTGHFSDTKDVPEVDIKEGKATINVPESASMSIFHDPMLALAMGSVKGVTAGGNLARKGLAATREAIGWLTGGASEVPALTKLGAKGVARIAEVPALAETAAKRTGKAFAEVPVKITGESVIEPIAKAATKATPKIVNETGLENLAKEQRQLAQTGSVTIGAGTKAPTYSFNTETEKLYQSAKGVKPEGIIEKIKNVATEVGHKFSRDYEHLANNAENAPLVFTLKRLEKQKDVVADRTTRAIGETLSGLNKQEYDLYSRKIFIDDLATDVKRGLYDNKELPFKLTPETLRIEKQNIDVSLTPKAKEALDKRVAMWDGIKSEYVDALKPYKPGIEDMFKENYYRHQVLDYVSENGIFGTGKRLRSPVDKSYTKGRKGAANLYNTDYLEAEHQIMAQMLHDAETAKALTAIQGTEDIAKKVRDGAKASGLKDWHEAIPEGYQVWQPKEGNVFRPVLTIEEKTLERLMSGELDDLASIGDELKQVLAVGGKRKEWVVRTEVADTLNNLVRERPRGLGSKAELGTMAAWKKWQLISPRRYFKYNIRNMTGDAEATFLGNPSGFKKSRQAVKELADTLYRKKPMTADMAEWFERGGMSSNLQAQEMDTLKKTWMFDRLHDKSITPNIWKKYWNTARLSTDYRESILRYANFLDYKEQLIKGAGKPNNYGASKPEMIDALTDINDKAFWLSNDLMGAYDRVSVAGQTIRERLIPFWSWQEVNAKRYIQLYKNTANDDKLALTIGKKLGAKGLVVPIKVGRLAIKTAAFVSLLQAWNQTKYPELEKDLPIEIKTKAHIILGKDSSGNTMYFNRMGTLDDFISWFGLDYAPKYVSQLIDGKISWKELVKEQATKAYEGPANKITQGAIPFTKLAAELVSRRSTFPDVFKTGTIRNKWLHVARSVGLENEFIAMDGLPSRGYADSVKNMFLYRVDPGEAAYRNTFDMKTAFMKKINRPSEGFWLTPSGDALYNMKLSIKYNDKAAFSKYISEYIEIGQAQGKTAYQIKKGMGESIKSMHPLYKMEEGVKKAFLSSLNTEDQNTVVKAIKFYNDNLSKGLQ